MSNENIDSCTKADQEAKHSFLYLFLTIFIPFGLGHFVSYLFRTVNALIYVDLERELHLPASSLGLLTGVYFLTFAAAQIPLGSCSTATARVACRPPCCCSLCWAH